MFASSVFEAQSERDEVVQAVPAYDQALWYAVYTAPRHEKSVASQMDGNDVDHFLPLYRCVHRWKDRRKELDLPLFPGYVFVHIESRDRLRVLRLPGVVHFVSFGGRPAPLQDGEIKSLRNGLSCGISAEPHPYLRKGHRVRIKYGPLSGLSGILTRRKDRFRLILSIEQIQRSIAVEVDEADVGPAD